MLQNHFRASLAFALTFLVSTHVALAQNDNKYDLGKPFGWAVCTSLGGGDFNLCGGQGGKSITLVSDGNDMSGALADALGTYDVVVLDGSRGPFIIDGTIYLNQKKNLSLLGINGATLQTAMRITDTIKAKMESEGVRRLSSSGNGGTLPNGNRVREEMEYRVRQLLIDYYNDPDENYRTAGILKLIGCDNVIIRDIRFEGPGSIDVGGDDLLTATGTTHLWVDHCDFIDGMDANFDINSRSDFITVSWCTFSYSGRSYIHMNTNLIGSSDSPRQGVDNLNVTFANCIWGKGCDQRMPMARFGTIHVLNCLYDCAGNSAAANARKDCEMRLEGCYFMPGVRRPFSQSDAKAWTLNDNFFSSPFSTENQGLVTLPYSYTRMPVGEVPEVLRAYAGCRRGR